MRSSVVWGVAVLAALQGAPAWAQAEAEAPEVIVTAQKRAQNLQETAAAISVLDADRITPAASNIEQLTTLVPTLNFRKGGTTLNSSLFLRGVGTINFSIAAEPSVASVVDGVVLARSGEAFGDLFDIERIEVLRGPQSTLAGKNASAGVVNIVTRSPGTVYGGEITVSAFEGQEYKARASVDLPLSDTVRTRWTGFFGQYDGFIRNRALDRDVNGYDRWGLRGVVDWDVTPALALKLTGDYRQAQDDCCAEVIDAPPAGANQAAVRSLLEGVDFRGFATRDIRQNFVTRTEEEAWGTSLTADYAFAGHTLTAITAWRSWDNTEIRDGDFLDRVGFVGNAFAQLHDTGPQSSTTFTQEVRLANSADAALSYVVGAYYYLADAERTFRRDVTVCAASTLAIDATGQRPCLPGASTFVSDFAVADFGSTFENVALFADGSFDLTDRFALLGGVRWTHDTLDVFHDRTPARVSLPGIRTDTTGFDDGTENGNWSGRAGGEYRVSDSALAYFTYNRGYKGPAFNVFFNQAAPQRNVIEPETVNSYEVGAKTAWFDDRLILNVDGYYAAYDNFQANNFDVLNGVVITRLTNAGRVSTKGFELDLQARPIAGLSFTGGVAYTDAQIEAFRDPTGAVSTAREGERLPLAPAWKSSLGTTYEWSPQAAPVDVAFNLEWSYTGAQFSDLGANPALRIDAYHLLDARITFSDKADRLAFSVIGRNLTDEAYVSLITPGGPGGALRYQVPRDADRYFGVSLTAAFGG